MDVIKNNYQGCDFQKPLRGEHIAKLLELTDSDTQKQLLEKLNHAQAVQALRTAASCILELQAITNNPDSVHLKESDWLKEGRSEIRLWKNLESALKNCDANEIRKAYGECLKKFVQGKVETFVMSRITKENFKLLFPLSENLKSASRLFYLQNKSEIDSENVFRSS